MFKKVDRVRLKKDAKFNNGQESITLFGSDQWPSNMTLNCISNEKDGYVDVAGPGITAHLLAERLRPETADDLD